MNKGVCDKCGDEVVRAILRPMGGGVQFCKECYCGRKKDIKKVVEEKPIVKVEVSKAADKVEKPKKKVKRINKTVKKVKKSTKKGK